MTFPSHFVDGHRVTCEESMRVVEMVLSGEINKNITSLLTHGAKAIGISGKDSSMINAVPKDGGKFGYTGEITKVNGEMINNLIKKDLYQLLLQLEIVLSQIIQDLI